MPHPTSRHKATTGELVQAGDPANNAVRVNIVAGAGSGGTAATDDAAFTVGGTSYTPVGGTYRSVLDSVDDGDGGVFAMTQTRAIFANIRDDAGDSAMDGANNALRVNIVAGAGSGGTAMTDDAVFTPAGTSITPIGAFADDTGTDSVDEGDGGVVRMSLDRILYSQTPDRIATATLGALDAAVTVELKGRVGAGLFITTANLNATVVPEMSLDGGTTWQTGRWYIMTGDSSGESTSASDVFSGGSATFKRGFVLLDGTTHVRARVSVYTSGSATAQLNATMTGPRHLYVSQVNPPWTVQLRDGNLLATIRDLAANDALNVAIVDGAGDQITSFGGGTQYTEDVAAAADPVGNATILVRQDTPAGLTTADGDNVARRGTNFGAAYTQILTSAGAFVDTFGGGTQYTEGDVDATITGTAAMMEVAGNTLQPVQGTVADGLLVNLGTNNDVIGTKTHDNAAPGANNLGVLPAVATAASPSWTEGNQVGLSANLAGSLRVDLATVTGTTINNAGGTLVIQPNSAHDAPVTGGPFVAGGFASATAPADVSANGDAVWSWHLRNGAQATVLTAAGALIGGDATNGLDVDVTRLPALVAGTANIGDVDVLTVPAPLSTTGGGTEATALRVTVANDSTGLLSVDDNGGSLTVDQGAAGTAWEVIGDVAGDVAANANPVVVGFRASTALPTAVSADADAVHGWANRNGAQVVAISPHIGLNSDPYNLIHEAAQYTTTQTSTVLIAGGASEKIVVTRVQIQVGGTTAGTLQLYFGTGAFSRGTNRAIFDGEFAPSSTLKPGVILEGPFISGTNGDDLLVTDSAAINPLTINVWYYIVT